MNKYITTSSILYHEAIILDSKKFVSIILKQKENIHCNINNIWLVFLQSGGINVTAWEPDATVGGSLSKLAFRQTRKGERISEKRGESINGRGKYQHPWSQVWLSHTAIATVTTAPRSGCTVTEGTGTQQPTRPTPGM